MTGLVLLVTIIAGIVLGALDFGFSELVERYSSGGSRIVRMELRRSVCAG